MPTVGQGRSSMGSLHKGLSTLMGSTRLPRLRQHPIHARAPNPEPLGNLGGADAFLTEPAHVIGLGPCAFAMPSRCLSSAISRSNCATEPRMPSINCAVGEPVSRCMAKMRSEAPLALTASTMFMRSRTERASRSSLVTTKTRSREDRRAPVGASDERRHLRPVPNALACNRPSSALRAVPRARPFAPRSMSWRSQ